MYSSYSMTWYDTIICYDKWIINISSFHYSSISFQWIVQTQTYSFSENTINERLNINDHEIDDDRFNRSVFNKEWI